VLKEEGISNRDGNRNTLPYNYGKLLMQVEVVDLSDQQKEYYSVGGSLTKKQTFVSHNLAKPVQCEVFFPLQCN
jgi:hypothetical protein